MNTVTLTDEEAKLFVLFREHQDVFQHLVKAKVFHVRGGKASLCFNFDGVLTHIDIDFQAYSRGRVVL